MSNFDLTTTSKYTWTGTVLPDVRTTKEGVKLLCVKPSPEGEGLGADAAPQIARRMCELATENHLGVDPFLVWLDGPFTAPEGAVLKKGEKSLYHSGPIPGTVLAELVSQADRIELVRGKKFPKPTLRLTKAGGAKKEKEEEKPKLSW